MSLGVIRPGGTHPQPEGAEAPPSRAAVRTGRLVVVTIVLAGVVGTLAIVRDAQTTSPVIAVPSQGKAAAPHTASQAAAAVRAFTPSGSSTSVAAAIAAATGNRTGPVGTALVRRLHRMWAVTLSVPVRVSALKNAGEIYTGGLTGGSNLATGLLDVTVGARQYVVHENPRTGLAVFSFRLAADGTTLSAMNWNANSMVTQTSVGNSSLP